MQWILEPFESLFFQYCTQQTTKLFIYRISFWYDADQEMKAIGKGRG